MKDLAQLIITSLVDFPEDVQVNSSEDEYGFINITATVNGQDMGRIIGKSGRIISAIRKILKIKAIKTGKRFRFDLTEPETPIAPDKNNE